jgi:hypothetical protein
VVAILASLLSQGRGGEARGQRLSLRLIAYLASVFVAGLLATAAIGFLIAALYQTFLLISDPIGAPLLVAATLAAATGLIVLAFWAVNACRGAGRPARDERQAEDGVDVLSFVDEMGAAISSRRIPPLTAIGLALAAGVAHGMHK